MQKKKSILLIAILVLVIALATTCCAAAKKYVIKVGFDPNPGEPTELSAKEWARLAKEQSKGQLELQLFPSSQLGAKKDLIEQARMGNNVITLTDFSFLADYVPDFNVLAGPYMGNTFEDAFKITESKWFAGLNKQLSDKGIRIVSTNWAFGTRNMIVNKPIRKPADLKGLKIRVSNNKMFVETFKAMGATPVPMPWGEAYTAITQGVIDGCDNPLTNLWGAGIHEKAKYVILTGHMNMISQWIIGQNYYKTLPKNVIKILEKTANEAGVFNNKIIASIDEQVLAKYKAAGIEIITPDKEAFKEATKDVYKKFPEWTPGVYDNVMSMLKK